MARATGTDILERLVLEPLSLERRDKFSTICGVMSVISAASPEVRDDMRLERVVEPVDPLP